MLALLPMLAATYPAVYPYSQGQYFNSTRGLDNSPLCAEYVKLDGAIAAIKHILGAVSFDAIQKCQE